MGDGQTGCDLGFDTGDERGGEGVAGTEFDEEEDAFLTRKKPECHGVHVSQPIHFPGGI